MKAKALVQLCRIANPYQYRQVQLDHKVGYSVWKSNFMLRTILNKLSFGVIPPPAIQLVSLRPDLSFKQVMLRVNMVTFTLWAVGSTLIIKISLNLFRWFTGG